MSRLFLFLALFGLTAFSSAQQHVFTDKQGRQIVAEIVRVNTDWKKMTIKKDGNPFEIEINILSLDDQQHVKNWLKNLGITKPGQTAPAPDTTTDDSGTASSPPPTSPQIDLDAVRLKVDINRKQVGTERRRDSGSARLITEKYVFDIEITSLGREVIPKPKVSYAAVWKEGVYFTADTYSSYYSSRNKFAIQATKELPNLTYNRKEVVTTAPVEINSVLYDNKPYYEDELLGVVARVTLADGSTVLGLFRNKGAEELDLSWESVARLPSDPKNDPIFSYDEEEMTNIELKKGQTKEGPINLANKDISISAKVTPATSSPDGVIVSIGGQIAGMALYVQDRKVYGNVKKEGNSQWISKPLPLGSFTANLTLNKEGLSLALNGGTPAVRDDVKRFEGRCKDGIEVGTDGNSLAGPYSEKFDFAGSIDNVVIKMEE